MDYSNWSDEQISNEIDATIEEIKVVGFNTEAHKAIIEETKPLWDEYKSRQQAKEQARHAAQQELIRQRKEAEKQELLDRGGIVADAETTVIRVGHGKQTHVGLEYFGEFIPRCGSGAATTSMHLKMRNRSKGHIVESKVVTCVKCQKAMEE